MTGQMRHPGANQQHEARLRALGALLTSRGYLADGLAIVAIGDDFVITGLRQPPPQSDRLRLSLRREEPPPPPPPTMHAETITAAELDAARAELRRRDERR